MILPSHHQEKVKYQIKLELRISQTLAKKKDEKYLSPSKDRS